MRGTFEEFQVVSEAAFRVSYERSRVFEHPSEIRTTCEGCLLYDFLAGIKLNTDPSFRKKRTGKSGPEIEAIPSGARSSLKAKQW